MFKRFHLEYAFENNKQIQKSILSSFANTVKIETQISNKNRKNHKINKNYYF